MATSARPGVRRSPARFAAVRAEPPGPGLGAVRDPLAREVRLLGSLLGQVIAEQAGADLFALVERIRHVAIAARRGQVTGADQAEMDAPARLAAEIEPLDLDRIDALTRAFTIYFRLVNLAEERQRVRTLRRRARRARDGVLDESIAEAVLRLGRDR
ncbi:MAG: phosphoenolpyruvate carboxylase, partial [Chloroflexota bacterium]